jgi:hypothetical protein
MGSVHAGSFAAFLKGETDKVYELCPKCATYHANINPPVYPQPGSTIMLTFEEFLLEDECAIYSPDQIKELEKFADKLLDKFGIDIEFTKHFGDRMGDSRNAPCIKISELQQLFKKIEKDKAKKIKSTGDQDQAVLVDLQKDLNLPFVVEIDDNDEFIVRFKTIMRKKDFKTTNKKIEY